MRSGFLRYFPFRYLVVLCGLVAASTLALGQKTAEHPRSGLVLSGGGAKGFAHIGVLKVLEEEGIRPDLITGTSMGSVVGGLYACGYSAQQIEDLVLSVHWDGVLTNKIPLDRIAMEEKPYYGRFLVELPFDGLKPKVPTGVIRGQKIDELLRRYTLPFQGTPDFDSLPIPFACVATDVSRGKAIVLRRGSLPDAIRASMAIPTVFTPLLQDSFLLVDGGTLRNFPVSDAKAMGADVVIGVQVGDGLVAAKDLHSAADILVQTSMFISLLEDSAQRSLCDVYLRPDLTGYGTSSFTTEAARALIQRGYEVADKHRTELRALAAGLPPDRRNLPPPKGVTLPDSIRVDRIEVISDSRKNAPIIRRRLTNKGHLGVNDLEQRLDLLYGTLNYDLINYHLDVSKGDSALVIKAISAPHEKVGISLNFDSFNQASAGVTMISRDRLFEGSRLMAEAYIGRYPQVEANFLKYIGTRRRYASLLGGYYERAPFPVRDVDDELSATLGFARYGAYLRTQTASSDRRAYGVELGWNHTLETPNVAALVETPVADTTVVIDLNAVDRFWSDRWAARFYTQFDNMDRPIYPRRGWKIAGSIGYYWGVKAWLKVTQDFLDDAQTDVHDLLAEDVQLNHYDQFERLDVQASTIQPLSHRVSVLAGGALVISSERDLTRGDQLLVGGMKTNGRESIPFWGLDVFGEQLPEFATISAGWQWEPVKDVFWQVKGNGLFTALRPGFVPLDNGDDMLFGAGSTLGLRTVLGIVQVGASNNLTTGNWLGYFNFGFRL